MRLLIIGTLTGDLARAAQMALARGAALDQADSIDQAMELLRREARVDLVLCDLAADVPALMRRLAAERIAVQVVACGVRPQPSQVAGVIKAGASDFLPLPPDPDLIAALLDAAAQQSHQMIARDPVMLNTIRRAEQIAGADASVLITGESGTGKEVLARHIHRRSRRAQSAFVALNCAAIPENLLESELFGHEKGAFSGAVARRIGRFEAANGGTLLLDEIGEMDIRLQAKLLRALQEREIDRIGGSAPVKVDVRILATTNRDLLEEVAAGRFREDLYFRLAVVSLRIPALRERPGDIRPMAEHFARRYAEVNGLPPRPLSDAAADKLAVYGWRGNVRELENCLHRAVLLAEGDAISPEAIEVGDPRAERAPAAPAASVPTPAAAPLSPVAPISAPVSAGSDAAFGSLVGRRMEDVERDLILHTLCHTQGNRTHAATMLGISIRALRNKLRDYAAQGVTVHPPAAGVAA